MSWQLVNQSLEKNTYQLALNFDLVITLHQYLGKGSCVSWKMVAEPIINKQWHPQELRITDINGAKQKAIDKYIECLQSLCLKSFNHRPKTNLVKQVKEPQTSDKAKLYQLDDYRRKYNKLNKLKQPVT